MFEFSNCSIECFECPTGSPTANPTGSKTSKPTDDPTGRPTRSLTATIFPTKTNSATSVPTLSPVTVPSCEKDNGKKFDYLGDKYSCKQLNTSKKKYRKRMCMRVKQARNLCPVICKYKI